MRVDSSGVEGRERGSFYTNERDIIGSFLRWKLQPKVDTKSSPL